MENVYSDGFITSTRNTRLFFRQWTAPSPRGSLIIVHGVGEHSGRYDEFARFLAEKGLSVFSFDLEGFGRSQGIRGHIADFNYYAQDTKLFIDHVRASLKEEAPLFLLGHSMGATVCLETVHTCPDLNLNGLILSGPPFRLNVSAAAWFRKTVSFLASLLPALIIKERSIDINMLTHDSQKKDEFRRDSYRHYRRSLRFIREFFKAEKKTFVYSGSIAFPILIVQGGEDRVIDVKKVEQFYQAISRDDKMLIIYPEMFHEVLNEVDRQRVFSDIYQWLNNHFLVKKQ